MPQMSPLMWELLNFFSVILILTLAVKIYWVNSNMALNSDFKISSPTNSITINWVW